MIASISANGAFSLSCAIKESRIELIIFSNSSLFCSVFISSCEILSPIVLDIASNSPIFDVLVSACSFNKSSDPCKSPSNASTFALIVDWICSGFMIDAICSFSSEIVESNSGLPINISIVDSFDSTSVLNVSRLVFFTYISSSALNLLAVVAWISLNLLAVVASISLNLLAVVAWISLNLSSSFPISSCNFIFVSPFSISIVASVFLISLNSSNARF